MDPKVPVRDVVAEEGVGIEEESGLDEDEENDHARSHTEPLQDDLHDPLHHSMIRWIVQSCLS